MNKKIRGGKTQLRAQRVWLLNSRRVKWQETVTGWQPQSAFFTLLEKAVKCYRTSFHQRSDNFWSTKWAWIHFFSAWKVAVSFQNRPKSQRWRCIQWIPAVYTHMYHLSALWQLTQWCFWVSSTWFCSGFDTFDRVFCISAPLCFL